MNVNGVWIGWGLGDWSHNPDGTDRDSTVRRFRAYARVMYASYAGHLANNNRFDDELYAVVVEMQRRLVESGALVPGTFISGVLDLETEYACGFKKRPAKALPIIFTVEGHLSNMFVGPCAAVASFLEGKGICHWKPIGYDSQSIPFNNRSGVNSLLKELNSIRVEGPPVDPKNPDGPKVMWDFGLTVPCGIMGFSQGAIITSKVWLHSLRPAQAGSILAARRDNLKRAIAFGNPYREKDVIAPWVPDPPRAGTQGISDERINGTPSFWQEHSRHGDLYAENESEGEVGLDKTAIYKIVSENAWWGGQAGILARIVDLLGHPVDGAIDIGRAIIGAGMFAANMGPHGSYMLDPCISWMAGVTQ